MNPDDPTTPTSERPHVDLSWAFDESEHPTEVTIFDPRYEITTHWITARKDDAYDLDAIA